MAAVRREDGQRETDQITKLQHPLTTRAREIMSEEINFDQKEGREKRKSIVALNRKGRGRWLSYGGSDASESPSVSGNQVSNEFDRKRDSGKIEENSGTPRKEKTRKEKMEDKLDKLVRGRTPTAQKYGRRDDDVDAEVPDRNCFSDSEKSPNNKIRQKNSSWLRRLSVDKDKKDKKRIAVSLEESDSKGLSASLSEDAKFGNAGEIDDGFKAWQIVRGIKSEISGKNKVAEEKKKKEKRGDLICWLLSPRGGSNPTVLGLPAPKFDQAQLEDQKKRGNVKSKTVEAWY